MSPKAVYAMSTMGWPGEAEEYKKKKIKNFF